LAHYSFRGRQEHIAAKDIHSFVSIKEREKDKSRRLPTCGEARIRKWPSFGLHIERERERERKKITNMFLVFHANEL
jgi:hypothetical protein